MPPLTADALLFASPPWLWAALGIVPAAAAMFLWAERRAGQRLARLIAARLRAQLAGADSPARRRARFALLTLALAALAVALARPQWGYEEQQVKRRGLDLAVAVDVSKSMLATDLAPNRLGRARLAILDLLGLLPGDRVGLIAFAGTAFLQAPLTIDYEAIRAAVAELDTDLIPRGGTNIAAAVDLALDAFGKGEGGHRAILLFTDGEELEDDAVKAAGRAAEAGVKVFTIGLGSAEGALVPLPRSPYTGSQGPGEFARDRSGSLVRSKLDENRLRQIAGAAGGSYVHLTNSSVENDMKTLVQSGLGALQAAEIDTRVNRRPIERFQWPLGFSLLCLGASTLLGERRRASRPSSRPIAVTKARRAAAVAAVSILLALLIPASGSVLRAANATPAPDPLELYGQGKYADAYEAYELQLKKRPDSGQLQFNAGASAFMAGQYDPALEAFSHALAAKDADADLQAKTFYNLGNTLARRGDAQKETGDARVNDYKNAIQYYNSVLQPAPAPAGGPQARPDPKQEPLRQNAAHNRDLVQKRLDEELKKRQQQKQQQQQQKSDGKKDPKDQKGQKKPEPPKPSSKPDQPPDSPGSETGDGQNQNPGQGEPEDGSPDQPPQPDPKDKANEKRGSKPPDAKPDEGDSKTGDDPKDRPPKPAPGDGDQDQSEENSPSDQDPAAKPSPDPSQNGPRPEGELTARDAGQPSAAEPGENPAEGAEGQAAKGRMSPREARALLNALRGEDDKVMLNNPGGKKARREPVYNDW